MLYQLYTSFYRSLRRPSLSKSILTQFVATIRGELCEVYGVPLVSCGLGITVMNHYNIKEKELRFST